MVAQKTAITLTKTHSTNLGLMFIFLSQAYWWRRAYTQTSKWHTLRQRANTKSTTHPARDSTPTTLTSLSILGLLRSMVEGNLETASVRCKGEIDSNKEFQGKKYTTRNLTTVWGACNGCLQSTHTQISPLTLHATTNRCRPHKGNSAAGNTKYI